ncbi:TraB/GumN family protein [Tritonibacter multivorans]|uniref:TraB/GumN family protein n=1 Tax=Tritonibacter multivorans TaxID=928856 RepID=UPI001F230127|nr:TraB/GumN family protein [Tritonibacter multivorans]
MSYRPSSRPSCHQPQPRRQTRRRTRRRTQWAFWTGAAFAGALASPLAAACTGTDTRSTLPPALLADVAAQVAVAPYAEGLYWTATRDDRVLHVIGTLHLNDPRFAAWRETFAPLFDSADALLVEATDADQAKVQKALTEDLTHAFITEGPSLIDRLSPQEWDHVAALARDAGLPPAMAAKMQPWFLSLSLALPLCAKQDPDIANGLDKRLMTMAKDADVPIAALEDALSVIGLMSDTPLDEQVEGLRSYLAMTQTDPNQLASLSAAYFDERVLEFTLIEEARFLAAEAPVSPERRQADLDELMDKMLLGRNAAWIPVIEATEGDQIVIGVGAMHLPGKGGVLDLLTKAGYQLARQPLPPADLP